MFKPITIYTAICDGCGKDFYEDSPYIEFSGWSDKDFVNDEAKENSWRVDEEKHYCYDCYEIYDNDEVILKQK